MSNLIWNVRFGGLFIQWANCPDIKGRRLRVSRVPDRPKKGERWFEIYEAPWQRWFA
jgi:hypothetical protein